MRVKYTISGKSGIVTINRPPVNAIDKVVRAEICKWMTKLSENPSIERIFLTGSEAVFSAGADTSEFDLPQTYPTLPEVISTIEKLRVPVIAAINGPCLGGGLELALSCSRRISDIKATMGFPEVVLGVVPGSGGTQRLPRLIGVEHAFSLIPEGRIIGAEEALEIGLIDEIFDDLMTNEFLKNLDHSDDLYSRVSSVPVVFPEKDLEKCRITANEKVGKKFRGQTAPYKAISLLTLTNKTSLESGLKAERKAFLELKNSNECKALRHLFFAERASMRRHKSYHKIKKSVDDIVVVGGGTMGASIAYIISKTGKKTTVIENSSSAVAKAHKRLQALFSDAVKRGLILKVDAKTELERIKIQVGYTGLEGANLAIEAVYEDVKTKEGVLKSIESAMPEAIIASNTSYLDLDHLAKFLINPSKLIGLHFFAPAHIMKLIEVVKGADTSQSAIATGYELAKILKKFPVFLNSCEGFIGNRLLRRVREIADFLLLDGAEIDQIDQAMTNFGYAMGLYKTQDLSGLDIAWADRKRTIVSRDPDRRYSPIQDQMCEAGHLGRKSGLGWYQYKNNIPSDVNPAVMKLVSAEAKKQGIERRRFCEKEIIDTLMAALINEAANLLAEGIAEDASAVDLVLVHGYGYPRNKGGPLFYADQLGLEKIYFQLKMLEKTDPVVWKISPKITELHVNKKRFHEITNIPAPLS